MKPFQAPSHSREIHGFLAALAGALIMGMAAIFVKWSQPAPAFAIGFYRMVFALIPLIPLASMERPSIRPTWSHRAWAIAGGLSFAGDLGLWMKALEKTSAANATLIVGLAPLWVVLASTLFLKLRLKKLTWLGLALALAGASILGLAKGARWGNGLGELLSVGASFCYAGFTFCLGQARGGLGTRRALTWASMSSLVGLGGLLLLSGDSFGPFPIKIWLSMASLGLVVQVGAWLLVSWGLGRISSAVGAIALLGQQVATVFLGWWLLGETLRPIQGIGVALLLLGMGLVTLHPPRPSRSG